ncbi:MAG: hypothetical protein KJO54_03735 [Gammaproteobacteria bacterium]|nr:hypothetical protein [Gammaproteobacteria bacterium]NNM20448.1 hypothetical protein [Gammaproteobacteria bacterium]
MGLARKNWLLFALVAALSWPAADAREAKAPSTVQDLVYGEILFEFYQDRYFEAITRQLVAVERGELDFHAEESELLSGGMYLAYGQQNQAEDIFARLLEKRASEEVQQQARLQLARSHYERGAYRRTVALLAERNWNKDSADQARALAAQAMLGLNLHGKAADLLRDLRGTPDAAFARYNLGVALAGQGEFDQAARQLERVGSMRVRGKRGLFGRKRNDDSVMPALRDKARLALGYAQIRNGLPDAALETLEDVRIDGPYASASLLGAGWAAAEMQRFDIALNAWRVLQQRDPADPAVQEAWFAVPYALGELNAHGAAAEAFEDSIAAIEDEDRALTAAIDTLESDGIAALLLANDKAAEWDAGWQLAEAPDHPLSRYLFLLMADNVFQQHLRDYRDLRALSGTLQRKRVDFDSYRNMLATRQQRFDQHATVAVGVADGSRLEELRARAAGLREQLAATVDADDYLALATIDERTQLAQLDAMRTTLAQLPPQQAAELAERQRVLHGLLRWQLSGDYSARLYQLRRELAAVEAELAEGETRRQQLVAALATVPQQQAQFATRIETMIPRVAAMQARIDITLAATDRRLVELATGELTERRVRLAQYLDQARYALAAIHDRAAAEGS